MFRNTARSHPEATEKLFTKMACTGCFVAAFTASLHPRSPTTAYHSQAPGFAPVGANATTFFFFLSCLLPL